MHKADLTSRAVAGFIDFLIVVGLTKLPDVFGFLSASGYILLRDGLFDGQSLGKKLLGLRVVLADENGRPASYRESIVRNITFVLVYILFLIPYLGWILGPIALAVEGLTAIGDGRGMRIGDMLAKTYTVQASAESGEEEASRGMKQGKDTPPQAEESADEQLDD